MNNIIFAFFFIPYMVLGQLNGTLSEDIYTCTGYPDIYLTFAGSNGSAPYTFYYNIDGGVTQTITTVSGNSVQLAIPTSSVTSSYYYLTQVVDDLGESTTLSDQAMVLIDQTPILDCGPDQIICIGNSTSLISSVTTSPFGGSQYSVSSDPYQDITNPFDFIPTITATYQVIVSSPFGCMDFDEVTITVNDYPINPDVSIDSAGCNNGSLQIIQSIQTLNYTYEWITGATSSGISNLASGTYSVDITDTVTGCQSNFSYQIPQSLIPQNCAEISGFVYFDADENCSMNAGDTPIANRIIVANPGNYMAITDLSGFYSMTLPTGTYSVEEIINNPNYGNFCYPSYTVSLINQTDSIGGIIFLDTLWEEIDLVAIITSGSISPGFTFYVTASFYSLTSFASLIDAEAWIKIPDGVSLQSWSYPHTISNDTIYFTLNTSNSFSSTLAFIADVTLPLGSQVGICSGIEIYQGEVITSNNTACNVNTVIGSYDPNDKTMFLNGVQSDSTILLTDEKLEYLIRFQNTGTAPAQNVYILDTINSTLNINSFEFITSSHPCIISILEGNVLKFNFPQIMLPDSVNNEPESHGFVRYSIKQSNQNTIGTIIKNTAHIYFDFNEAVVTNTTYDEIVPFPAPNASISDDGTVCQYAPSPTITLLGSNSIPPYNFTYNINGGNNETISSDENGYAYLMVPTSSIGVFNYSVVSVSSNIGGTSQLNETATITIDECLGIGEIDVPFVNIYPNPVNFILTIECNLIIHQIEIRNVNGQIIKEIFPIDKTVQLNMKDLSKGIYFIQMNCEGGETFRRVIVE
jgi:uncharacterized repeat protein (TIGR01451 family)